MSGDQEPLVAQEPTVDRRPAGWSVGHWSVGRWSWVAVVVLVVVVGAMQAQWIISERSNLVVEIDESSYLWQAVSAAQRATSNDPGSVASLYFDEGNQNAPLLSALTVPFLVGGSLGLRSALFAQVAVLAALVLATFLLARRLAGHPWSVLAAAAVATAPAIVDYTRTYHFALLATATMTAALWCLLATDRFTRPWPALGWGLLMGLALLSRTMMVSLVPGLVLAGLVAALVPGPESRRRRMAWWAAGVGVAAVVALPWWVSNWDAISNYLTGYGYGGEGTAYGPLYSPLEAMYYLRIPYRVAQELYLPLALLVLAGLVLLAAQAAGVARRQGLGAFVRHGIERGHLLVALVVATGAVALMSSRNKGTGFVLPLVPMVVVLAVVGLRRLRASTVRRVSVAVIVTVLLVGVVMKSGAETSVSAARRTRSIGTEGAIPITDGRSHLGAYLASSRYPEGFDVSGAATEALTWMADHSQSPEYTIAAAVDGDLLFTPGYLILLATLRGDPLQIRYVGATADGSVASYREVVADRRNPTPTEFLVTLDLDPFPASHSGAAEVIHLEAAAVELGFEQVHEIPLVGDRTIRIWQRDLGE